MPRHLSRYHYALLGLSLLASVSVWGVRFALGLLLDPLVALHGWTYGQITLSVSIFMLVSALTLPLAGWLVDRFGARMPITAGVALVGAGLLCAARAGALWQLYLALGVLAGMGFSLAGSTATAALLTRWFDRGRGLAIGVNNSGIQVSQLLWGPLVGALALAWGIQWTLLALGAALVFLVAPVLWATVRSAPDGTAAAAGRGGAPSGPNAARAPAGTDAQRRPAGAGYAFLRRTEFWLLAGGLASCGFTMGMIMTHLPGMFLRAGASPAWVAVSLSISGLFGIFGQMLAGWLSDRWGQGQVLTFVYAYRAVSIPLIVLYPSFGALVAFSAGFGLFGNGTLTATSTACSRIFGQENVGKTFGLTYMLHQVGAVAGSWLGGWAVDVTAGYGIALVATAVISAGGALSSALIPRYMARPLPGAAPHLPRA